MISLASFAPIAKDCADWGLADCGLVAELAKMRFRGFGPPQAPYSWAGSESARKVAQNAPLGSVGGRSWARAVPGSNA
eukprot:6824508-Alexandrium_andersonii.AAC.1